MPPATLYSNRSLDEKLATASNDFIARQLPAWLAQASPQQLARLRSSYTRHKQDMTGLQARTRNLKPVQLFAEERFNALLTQPTGKSLNIAELEWRVVTPRVRAAAGILENYGYQASRSSGLMRLMRNFEAGTSYFQGSGLVQPGENALQWQDTTALIRACRALDAGALYQAELNAVFSADTLALLGACKRSGLQFAIDMAALKGELTTDVQAALEVLSGQAIAGSHRGLQASAGALEILGAGVADGLYIELRNGQGEIEGLLFYLPDDPEQGLRWFATLQDMEHALVAQLQVAAYREHFCRWVALEDRASFMSTLQLRLRDPHPDLEIRSATVSGQWFVTLAENQVARLKADARLLLVPTAEADEAASRARHAAWVDAGLDALSLAGLFIPLIGAVLLGQLVAQTLSEVFEGAVDWYEGHRHEAFEHMLAVAGIVASTGATAMVAGAVRSAFVEELEPVRSAAGERLWASDLKPYATTPDAASLQANGLFGNGQQQWMRAGRNYYEVVRPDPHAPYRLRHPRRSSAYGPVVLHNGERGWRLQGDLPHAWEDSARMLDVLWPQQLPIDAERAQQVLQVAGIDTDELRGVLVENRPAPINLRETLRCFETHTRIEAFFQQLKGRTLTEDAIELLEWCESQPDVGKGFASVLSSTTRLRIPLFKHLMALPETDDVIVGLLKRAFPGLPDAYARALSSEATETQIATAGSSKRLPRELLDKVAPLQRVARLNRALAGLHWRNAYNDDTGALAMTLLAQLEPEGLSLQLRESDASGRLLGSMGPLGQGGQQRVLVFDEGEFRLFDGTGQALAMHLLDPGNLFEVLASILSPGQLAALGIAGSDQGTALRYRLIETLPATHEGIGRMLGLSAETRWFNPGRRLDDGRVGYPLSGRPRIPRTPRDTLRDGLHRYFPGLSDNQLDQELERLMQNHVSAFDVLRMLQDDYEQLELALTRWADVEFNDARRQTRELVINRLRRAWQAQGEIQLDRDGDETGQRLSLAGFHVTTLPELPAHIEFSYITVLTVSDTPIRVINSEFLRTFGALRVLNLHNNQLETIPSGIAHLVELVRLRLDNNRIRLTANSLSLLSGLPQLAHLNLSYNLLGQMAFGRNRLLHLITLNLRHCNLGAWPAGIERCGFLRSADLRDNALVDVPAEILQMPYEFRRSFLVSHNALSATALQRLYALDSIIEEQLTAAELAMTPQQSRVWWAGNDADRLMRWDTWVSSASSPGFREFFRRLPHLAGFSWSRDFMLEQGWRVLQGVVDNPELRRQVENLTVADLNEENAIADCFSQILRRCDIADAERNETAERGAELLELGRSLFRLDLLEWYVRGDVQQRRFNREQLDQVAISLNYRVRLRRRLGLRHEPQAVRQLATAQVSEGHITAALNAVERAETPESLAQNLCRRPFWQALLRQLYPVYLTDPVQYFAQLRQAIRQEQATAMGEQQRPDLRDSLVVRFQRRIARVDQLEQESLQANDDQLHLMLTLEYMRRHARADA